MKGSKKIQMSQIFYIDFTEIAITVRIICFSLWLLILKNSYSVST
jgi:hypothetical protein